MIFIAKDEPEDVIAFYKEQLSDWSYDEEFQAFWDGPSDPKPGYAKMISTYKTVIIGEYGQQGYPSSINITVPE